MTATSSSERAAGAAVCAAILVGMSVTALAISVEEASRFIGQRQTVEGKVTATRRDGNVVRLQLGDGTLSVALLIGALSTFPAEPEHYYLGKTVRVSGTIRSFRGATELTVNDPARIAVAGEAAAPAPVAAAAPADAGVQQRLQAIERRVERLEEQVERLTRPGAP